MTSSTDDTEKPLLDSSGSDDLKQQVQALTTELNTALDNQITQLREGSKLTCISCCFKNSNIKKIKELTQQLKLLQMSVYGPCDYESGADNVVLLNLCILAKESSDFCTILADIINNATDDKYNLVKKAISKSGEITEKKIKDYLKNEYSDEWCTTKLAGWECLLSATDRLLTFTNQPVVKQPDKASAPSSKPAGTGGDNNGEDALDDSNSSGSGRRRSSSSGSAGSELGDVIAKNKETADQVNPTPTALPADEPLTVERTENVGQYSRQPSDGEQQALDAVAALIDTESGTKQTNNQPSGAPGQLLSAVAVTGANIRTKLQTNDKTEVNRRQNANSITEAMNTDGLGEYRRARGDGNCFYHATIFLWLSELCEKDPNELTSAKKLLLETVNGEMHPNLIMIDPRTLNKLPQKDIDNQTNKANMKSAINTVFILLKDNQSKDTVISFMSEQKNLDHCLALVQIARQMTINTLQTNPALYKPSNDDPNAKQITLDEYITGTASVMGKSAETYMIPAWSKAIGHNIIPVTANIFESQAHQEAKDFIEENAYNNPLVIILSGGHYDILLPTPEKLTRLKNEAVLDNIMKQLENSYMTLDQPRYIQQNTDTLQQEIKILLENDLEKELEAHLIIQDIVSEHYLVKKPQGIIEEAEIIIREMDVFDEEINPTQFEAAVKKAIELLYNLEDSENLNEITPEDKELRKECFIIFTLNRANLIYEIENGEYGRQQQKLLKETAESYFDENPEKYNFTINKETADAALASRTAELDDKLEKKKLSFNVIFDIIAVQLEGEQDEKATQHKQTLQSYLSKEKEYKLFETCNCNSQKNIFKKNKQEYNQLCNQKIYDAERWLEILEGIIHDELIFHIRDEFTLTVAKPDNPPKHSSGSNGKYTHVIVEYKKQKNDDEGESISFWCSKKAMRNKKRTANKHTRSCKIAWK